MSTAIDYEAAELADVKRRITKMVELETKGFGDDLNALKRICKDFSLPFWTVVRIKEGKAKKASGGIIRRVRKAELAFAEKKVRVLQQYILSEKAKHPDADYEDLLEDARNLAAKVQEKRAQIEGA